MKGKKIVLIITGGIAAYKMPGLVRDFVKAGAEVKVVLTPAAGRFVSALTLSTLSKNDVQADFFSETMSWNNHVELALWADLLLVAPCTANTLGKMAHGLCDNLAMAVYMSAKCQVFIAPAMDLDMYAHPSTLQNLKILQAFGHSVIPAEIGELASGLSGQGRLAAPEVIFKEVSKYFEQSITGDLAGKTVLVTAGPTYEAIDPVRFIGNHSSGKMGFAIADEAARRGAKVILVSGPTAEILSDDSVELHRVTSAQEMYDEVFKHYHSADIAIASAAVADYAPKVVAPEKIKKSEDSFTLELVKNPDILKAMGEQKTHQFLVGFALETQNEEENARLKLQKKNLDMIVLNSLRDAGAGFRENTNKVSIMARDEVKTYELKSKVEVAKDILNLAEDKMNLSTK